MREHVGRALKFPLLPFPFPVKQLPSRVASCVPRATSFFSRQFSPKTSILLPWGKHCISFKSDRHPATRIGDISKLSRYLTIVPRARMGSKPIAHEAEGQMGY